MTEWLVADVGGTNTRVALAGPDGVVAQSIRSFANDDFAGLTPLVVTYLQDSPRPPDLGAICAGVAGPVQGGTAQLTNRNWFIDTSDIGAATGVRDIHLLNDLQAQGFALDDLAPDSLHSLIPGKPDPDGARLVLGLGTGCNIAVAHKIGGLLFVPPAEAGHTTLPHIPEFSGLMDRLEDMYAHLPIEALLSGPGLSNLHMGLTGKRLSPAEIIQGNAVETLRIFVQVLGHVAGNLCLTHMATGGLYLIGGTARAIAPHLTGHGFTTPFTAKGPYAHIMRDIPVSLITDDTAALRGCTRCLQQMHIK